MSTTSRQIPGTNHDNSCLPAPLLFHQGLMGGDTNWRPYLRSEPFWEQSDTGHAPPDNRDEFSGGEDEPDYSGDDLRRIERESIANDGERSTHDFAEVPVRRGGFDINTLQGRLAHKTALLKALADAETTGVRLWCNGLINAGQSFRTKIGRAEVQAALIRGGELDDHLKYRRIRGHVQVIRGVLEASRVRVLEETNDPCDGESERDQSMKELWSRLEAVMSLLDSVPDAITGTSADTTAGDQPPAIKKRKRRGSIACTSCREGKVKCIGEDPCERCQKNNTKCMMTSQRYRKDPEDRRKRNVVLSSSPSQPSVAPPSFPDAPPHRAPASTGPHSDATVLSPSVASPDPNLGLPHFNRNFPHLNRGFTSSQIQTNQPWWNAPLAIAENILMTPTASITGAPTALLSNQLRPSYPYDRHDTESHPGAPFSTETRFHRGHLYTYSGLEFSPQYTGSGSVQDWHLDQPPALARAQHDLRGGQAVPVASVTSLPQSSFAGVGNNPRPQDPYPERSLSSHHSQACHLAGPAPNLEMPGCEMPNLEMVVPTGEGALSNAGPVYTNPGHNVSRENDWQSMWHHSHGQQEGALQASGIPSGQMLASALSADPFRPAVSRSDYEIGSGYDHTADCLDPFHSPTRTTLTPSNDIAHGLQETSEENAQRRARRRSARALQRRNDRDTWHSMLLSKLPQVINSFDDILQSCSSSPGFDQNTSNSCIALMDKWKLKLEGADPHHHETFSTLHIDSKHILKVATSKIPEDTEGREHLLKNLQEVRMLALSLSRQDDKSKHPRRSKFTQKVPPARLEICKLANRRYQAKLRHLQKLTRHEKLVSRVPEVIRLFESVLQSCSSSHCPSEDSFTSCISKMKDWKLKEMDPHEHEAFGTIATDSGQTLDAAKSRLPEGTEGREQLLIELREVYTLAKQLSKPFGGQVQPTTTPSVSSGSTLRSTIDAVTGLPETPKHQVEVDPEIRLSPPDLA